MISPKKKSKKQKPKNEDPDKLDQEKEQRKSTINIRVKVFQEIIQVKN